MATQNVILVDLLNIDSFTVLFLLLTFSIIGYDQTDLRMVNLFYSHVLDAINRVSTGIMSVGNDGMIKIISFLLHYLLFIFLVLIQFTPQFSEFIEFP